MGKYKNRYRQESTRLKGWDYRNNGVYFITICTAKREHFFGSIFKGTMQLSQLGSIAESYWKEIPNHFPHVLLANFVIMPDHMHGILIIDRVNEAIDPLPLSDPVDETINIHMSKISPQAGSISTIIRSYKSVVTKNARKINPNFGWQSKFHDHIIRDTRAFENIQKYITNNPANW